MLKKGTTRDHPAEEAAGHMANIRTYADKVLLQIAGPFMDDDNWRGIASVEAMCNDDPAVKAGRLACEIHP